MPREQERGDAAQLLPPSTKKETQSRASVLEWRKPSVQELAQAGALHSVGWTGRQGARCHYSMTAARRLCRGQDVGD
jgi:hypothetical protein